MGEPNTPGPRPGLACGSHTNWPSTARLNPPGRWPELSQPIDPSDALAIAVTSQLGDKHFRASLRKMHEEGYPLVRIIDDLGLEEEVSPALRATLENLGPSEIAAIRKATFELLDREEHRVEPR